MIEPEELERQRSYEDRDAMRTEEQEKLMREARQTEKRDRQRSERE